jgi:hypothetical protein
MEGRSERVTDDRECFLRRLNKGGKGPRKNQAGKRETVRMG